MFVLICALLSSGCDNGVPPLPRLAPDAVVLAYGDSLTFGTGAAAEMSYPARLQQMLGRTVVNAGVPGETSNRGLQRLPALLDKYQPQLLVLCHGGNDILRRMSRSVMKQNIDAMITLAKQRGIAVLLIAVPEFGLLLSPPEVYSELAEQHNIPVELEILPDILRQPSLKADQVHPNAAGYQQLADAIHALLKKSDAI